MDNLNKDIDLLLEYSLIEAPTRMGSLSARDFTRFKSKKAKEAEEAEEEEAEEEEAEEEEAEEEEPSEDEDEEESDAEEESGATDDDGYCDQILNDPELKDLLDNIESAGTLRRETANMLRNVSLTVDMLTFAVAGGAVGATAMFPGVNLGGAAFALGTLKAGGAVSGGTLLAASLFDILNGDFKAAAIDGGTGLLSLALSAAPLPTGAGASTVAKAGTKAAAAAAGKQATKNIAQRLGANIAGAAAKVETKVVTALVSKGMAQEVATVVAKNIVQQSLNAGSNKLRELLGDIPVQGPEQTDEQYKEVLIQWQNQQSEKIAKIYDKCFKRAPESAFKSKARAFVRGIDKYVGFTARWLGKATKAVKGLYNKIMGEGTLNESQIKTIKELGLGDMILLKEEKLVTIHIDLTELKKQELNESFLSMFGGWVEHILGAMFGVAYPNIKVTGSRGDVQSFARALAGEKNYIEAVKRYGLDHPTTYKNKAKLDRSIKGFERDTGLKWPFK